MKKNVLQDFWTGILAFWIPLVLIAYSVKLVWPVIGKLSKPIARLLPFHNALGEILDSIIGVAIILMITLLVGWIARKTMLKRWASQIDRLLTKLSPNYSFYKNFLSDTAADEQEGWKSVIIKDEDGDKLGFVVDERDGLCTVYIPSAPNPYQGEVVFKERATLHPVDISFKQAIGIIRRYGKGFAEAADGNKNTFGK